MAPGDKAGGILLSSDLRVKVDPNMLAKRETRILRHMLAFERIPGL